MLTRQKNEKGSLLIEIIAVLGLIALITPILFRQVQRRNEEIIDAQIASEMRAVKDAVAAYIQTNEETLATQCGLKCGTGAVAGLVCTDIENGDYGNTNGGEADCGITLSFANLSNFFSGTSTVLADYEYYVYGRTVKQGTNSYRPVIYGVVVQIDPMENLRRASKVASLIGLEGGVVYGGKVHGMQGVWSDAGITTPENAVVATTSFDDATNSAILKDATFQHMQASGSVQAPVVAAKKIGVMDILTVDNDESCIADYGNDSVSIIATDDTGSTCAPFFEVNPATKEVRLKGVIKTGVATGATCTATTKTACEAVANCVWVSKPTTEAPNAGECVGEYLLNPAETSMVEDIKLGARGGAKLSDLLPKWILMDTYFYNTGDGSNDWWMGIPICQNGYTPVIVVTPIRTKILTNVGDIPTDAAVLNEEIRIRLSATGHSSTNLSDRRGSNLGDVVGSSVNVIPEILSGSTWVNARNQISVQAQTYCVFDRDES